MKLILVIGLVFFCLDAKANSLSLPEKKKIRVQVLEEIEDSLYQESQKKIHLLNYLKSKPSKSLKRNKLSYLEYLNLKKKEEDKKRFKQSKWIVTQFYPSDKKPVRKLKKNIESRKFNLSNSAYFDYKFYKNLDGLK